MTEDDSFRCFTELLFSVSLLAILDYNDHLSTLVVSLCGLLFHLYSCCFHLKVFDLMLMKFQWLNYNGIDLILTHRVFKLLC